MQRALVPISSFWLCLSLGAPALAADFYVDPASGSASNDGSQGSPWKTLEEVVNADLFGTTIHAGDTVHVLGGYHGDLDVSSGDYDPPITIEGADGATAELGSASFGNTSGWVLRGVSVSPSHAPTYSTIDIVSISTNASDIVVENCKIFSIEDSSGWSADDWVNVASSGISLRGANSTARNNTITNVRFGISADNDGALVENNSIVNFSADGLRGLGNNETFQYNLVKNSYVGDDEDENHDDGFQSWSVGDGGVGTGEVVGMVLRGNVIINAEDPAQPMKGTLQGIGCFDGYFTDWVVENNVVITNHWHGISLYGARDSRVVNNTVIDNESGQPGPPWISVTDHKDGTPSENTLVRNNLVTDLDVSGNNVTEDHNTILQESDFAAYFVDASNWDLHLLPNAPALDQGSADQAPELDADAIPRPQGAGVDLGAYEWHEPGVTPTGGSGGAGAGASGGGGNSGNGGNGGSTGGAKASGEDSGDEGGCGCRTTSRSASGAALFALSLALSAAVIRRRRASRPSSA
jgi:MYXO-CTERM domain-containing protein